jgi:hypothetical protein
LECHPLLDHGATLFTVEQRLLNPGETAPQHADDEVVLVIGLGLGRADPVVLLLERDHPV